MRVLFWTLLGFFSGSLPFSMWIGYLIARTDIRRYGDGNPGAINAWRAGGWRAGMPAMLLDYLKGTIPVTVAHFLVGISGWALMPVAVAPVLGHAFSPFLHFRGGKAVATTLGIWTGLTLWMGPTTLGLAFTLAFALNSADAWSVMLGMLALLVSLLVQQTSAPFLAVWAGNLAVLIWKHRHDLQTPPQPRPWLCNLMERFR